MIGKWETIKIQLDSRVIRLLKQEDFYGPIAFTYFVKNCLDLPQQYLRNKNISKVLIILFPKKKSIYMWQKVYNSHIEYISYKNCNI